MKIRSQITLVTLIVACANSVPAPAQVQLDSSGYFQDFNSLENGLPVAWSIHTSATASSIGNGETFTSEPASWASGAGSFKNFAAGLPSTADATQQGATNNRALGIRQTGPFGDPGAAFVFNFNSSGTTLKLIELDLLMLSVQTRSTTWTIDYAIGDSPTTFTSLDTWTDPGLFGSTHFVFDAPDELGALSNQSNVWFRIVALEIADGAGIRDSIAIDNFAITVIPEPATYAALLSIFTLTFAAFRRQKS